MPLKTLQFELSGWKGMDRWTPETECDPHYWYDILNMECDEQGVTSKRRGYKDMGLTISGTVNLIYNHFSANVPPDQVPQRAVVIAGSVLNVIYNLGSDNTVEATFSVSDSRHYACTDDLGVTFITNEAVQVPKMLAKVGSNWIYQDITLVAPLTISMTSGTTSSDSLSGDFEAVYTYVDIWGNESPLSRNYAFVTNVIEGASVDVIVTASADPTVDHIAIYLLGPGMSEYQFAGTFSNTDGTFSFTQGMAELMAGDLVDDTRVDPPVGKYVTIYEDMLLIAGNFFAPDAVFCSNRQFHRQFSDNFSRAASGDGQTIRGFGESYDRKVVLKGDSLFLCEGDHQDTFNTKLYSKGYGAVGQPVVAKATDAMAWWSYDGLYADDGQNPQEISRRILSYLRQCDYRNMVGQPPQICAARYKYYRQIHLAMREYQAEAGANDVVLVWNYMRDSWTKNKGIAPYSMGTVQNLNDYEYLYVGTLDGKVLFVSPPNYSSQNNDTLSGTASTTISCVAETPWMNFAKLLNAPDWERTRIIPRYLEVYASGEPAPGGSDVTLTCGYYVDFDRDTEISSFDLTFPANAWPTVRPYRQTIYYGGQVGTFRWTKWRFTHAVLGEHIKIHKLVWGFKLKPSID